MIFKCSEEECRYFSIIFLQILAIIYELIHIFLG